MSKDNYLDILINHIRDMYSHAIQPGNPNYKECDFKLEQSLAIIEDIRSDLVTQTAENVTKPEVSNVDVAKALNWVNGTMRELNPRDDFDMSLAPILETIRTALNHFVELNNMALTQNKQLRSKTNDHRSNETD